MNPFYIYLGGFHGKMAPWRFLKWHMFEVKLLFGSKLNKNLRDLCCGGGHVVIMLAFYSNNPSSNPAEAYSFYVKIVFKKKKNKQKEARFGTFKKT